MEGGNKPVSQSTLAELGLSYWDVELGVEKRGESTFQSMVSSIGCGPHSQSKLCIFRRKKGGGTLDPLLSGCGFRPGTHDRLERRLSYRPGTSSIRTEEMGELGNRGNNGQGNHNLAQPSALLKKGV